MNESGLAAEKNLFLQFKLFKLYLFPCAFNLFLIEYNQKILSIILALESTAVLL